MVVNIEKRDFIFCQKSYVVLILKSCFNLNRYLMYPWDILLPILLRINVIVMYRSPFSTFITIVVYFFMII